MKRFKFFIASIAIIFIATIAIIQGLRIYRKTIFDDYTKFLGKKASELPKSYIHEESLIDDEYAATPEDGIIIKESIRFTVQKKQEKPALNLMISNCTRLRKYFLIIRYVIAMSRETIFSN